MLDSGRIVLEGGKIVCRKELVFREMQVEEHKIT
jgi:hypothetical protein